jgi:hypothetical protein
MRQRLRSTVGVCAVLALAAGAVVACDDDEPGGPATARADGGSDGPVTVADAGATVTDGAADGGDGGGGDGASGSSSGTTAAQGGTFTSSDGRLTLEIPHGAFDQSVDITIAPVTPTPAGALGAVYRIEPEGMHLLKPAKVSIKFSAAELGPGMADDTRLGRWQDQWIELSGSRPNVSAMTTTAPISVLGTVGLLPGICRACPATCAADSCRFGVDPATAAPGVAGRCANQGNGCSVCVPACDGDGDGFCPGSPGQEQPGGDCNDGDPTVYPDALEVCGNSLDDDCDSHADDGCKPCGGDADCGGVGREACLDGVCSVCDMGCTPAGCVFGNEMEGMVTGRCQNIGVGCNVCVPACDMDGDGFCPGDTVKGQPGGDCDDSKGGVSPKATEICGNGLDDDCNGFVDDQCKGCDKDGDCPGMGVYCAAGSCHGCLAACDAATCMFKASATDAGVKGKCASYGNGCSRCVPTCDGDGDGYCILAGDHGEPGGDCKDTDAFTRPGAIELCGNNADDNCNAQVDEGCNPCKTDGECKQGNQACLDGLCDVCMGGCDPEGCKFGGGDPMMAGSLPAVKGRCHGYGVSCTRCVPACDMDGDGYCPGPTVNGQEGGDCDDANGSVAPRMLEVCGNKLDDNCDGNVDEACATCTSSAMCAMNQRCSTGK